MRSIASAVLDNDVSAEFTTDSTLIREYVAARRKAYAMDPVVSPYTASPIDRFYDCDSHILVLRKAGRCIGGARLTIRTPGSKHILPMEDHDISLSRYFPALPFKTHVHGEVSRLTLLPEYRAGMYSEIAFKTLYRKSLEYGVSYLSAISDIVRHRRYLQLCQQLGVLVHTRKTGQPEFAKTHLLVADFTAHGMMHSSIVPPTQKTV